VAVAGVVTHRQRPGTAGGVTFLSLEDETGLMNVICTAGVWQRFRTVARRSGGARRAGQVGDGRRRGQPARGAPRATLV